MKRAVEALLVAGVCAFALYVCAPLTQEGWFDSHEADTYVMRSAEYLDGLREGHLYPRWAGNMYGGFGAPFFVFYPPVVYALGAIAGFAFGSIVLGLKLVLVAVTLLAGLSMYLLARRETERPDAAALAAALYIAAPYRLWDLYGRGDLAEYTALAFLPLALYGYRSVTAEPSPARAVRFGVLAALAHAACMLTHTLTGFFGTAALALVVLASAYRGWRRGARAQARVVLGAFACALVMGAVYTLPAMLEKRLVRINTMTSGLLAPDINWLTLGQLSELGHFFYLPAVLAAALLLLIAAVLKRRVPARSLGYLAIATVVLILQLPQLSAFWTVAPFLRIIQFPWRLLGIGWIASSVLLGMLWALLVRGPLLLRALAASQLSWLFLILCYSVVKFVPYPGGVRDSPEAMRSSLGATTVLDEYLPRVVPGPPWREWHSVVATGGKRVKTVWEAHTNSRHLVSLKVRRPGAVELNLHDYPGWQIENVSGPAPVQRATTTGGHVALEFAEAGQYQVLVGFSATPLRLWASRIALAALIGLQPLLYLLAAGWLDFRRLWLDRLRAGRDSVLGLWGRRWAS